MEIKAGILAIGNEVVDGQIVNRNASWLSEQLNRIGVTPLLHLSCKDDLTSIIDSLNHLSQSCDLILSCGGLGPTKDDMTKEALAQWLGVELKLNNEQWKTIQDKLRRRDVQLREGHKTQAMLPKDCTVLANEPGVAPGFFIENAMAHLACLPGPPREMHAMFSGELAPLIQKTLRPKQQQRLHTWICLGAAESEIAHIVESIVGHQLDIGFRIYKPYVEIKVWLPAESLEAQFKSLKLMEEKLRPWLVARSIKDIRSNFLNFLNQYQNVFVIDHTTGGLLLEKIKECGSTDHLRYQCFEHKAFRYFTESEVRGILDHMSIGSSEEQLFISLFPKSEHQALLSLNENIQLIDIPSRMAIQSTLGQLYLVEKCFLKSISGQ